jgi:hypothetical protein
MSSEAQPYIHPLADVQTSQVGGATKLRQFDVVLNGARIVALEFAGKPKPIGLGLTLQTVRQVNSLFYSTMKQVEAPDIHLVDVAEWMCTRGACDEYDGNILYRDSNHLSTYGSVHYASSLEGVI